MSQKSKLKQRKYFNLSYAIYNHFYLVAGIINITEHFPVMAAGKTTKAVADRKDNSGGITLNSPSKTTQLGKSPLKLEVQSAPKVQILLIELLTLEGN